jgi:hypothetical protein
MLAGMAPQDHILGQAFRRQYWRKVRSIRPGSLYAYRPIWEPDGTDVQDYSGLGDRATSTGLGVRNPGPDGVHQAPAFNGTPSHVNVMSAEFISRYNGQEGTVLFWAKAASVGFWTDTNNHCPVLWRTDANNVLMLYKPATDFNFIFYRVSGGAASGVTWTDLNPGADWFMLGLSWSNVTNELKAYLNGIQKEATGGGGGIYAGDLTSAYIGAYDNVATFPWLGYLAHVALWNVPLSASEIKSFSEV